MKIDEPVFYAIYEGRPTPQAQDAAEVDGASIVCWVRATSKAEAADLARRAIENRRWVIVAVDEPWVEAAETTMPRESRRYLEQAKVDGECYVFHTWTNDAEDAEPSH
jgi:predicted RNase H-like nuclease